MNDLLLERLESRQLFAQAIGPWESYFPNVAGTQWNYRVADEDGSFRRTVTVESRPRYVSGQPTKQFRILDSDGEASRAYYSPADGHIAWYGETTDDGNGIVLTGAPVLFPTEHRIGASYDSSGPATLMLNGAPVQAQFTARTVLADSERINTSIGRLRAIRVETSFWVGASGTINGKPTSISLALQRTEWLTLDRGIVRSTIHATFSNRVGGKRQITESSEQTDLYRFSPAAFRAASVSSRPVASSASPFSVISLAPLLVDANDTDLYIKL